MSIIEAASILKSRGVDFRWFIVGEGPERERIEASVHVHSLEGHVTLLGALPSTEVRRLMLSSQLFALASTSESAGMVYMEAMATETPVVGTNVMGVSEIVFDQKTGFLVPANDPLALANKVEALLEDSSTRHQLGVAGRQHVLKNLSLDGQVDKLLKIWRVLD